MSDKPDLSELFSMLSSNSGNADMAKHMIENLMNSSNATNSSNSTNTNEKSHASKDTTYTDDINQQDGNPSNSIPDMETILKLMNVMKFASQDNPSKELLRALKPFLNDSRKEKVEQYVKIVGLTKAMELFNEMNNDKSDSKGFM